MQNNQQSDACNQNELGSQQPNAEGPSLASHTSTVGNSIEMELRNPDYFKDLRTGKIYPCIGADGGFYWTEGDPDYIHLRFDPQDCEPIYDFEGICYKQCQQAFTGTYCSRCASYEGGNCFLVTNQETERSEAGTERSNEVKPGNKASATPLPQIEQGQIEKQKINKDVDTNLSKYNDSDAECTSKGNLAYWGKNLSAWLTSYANWVNPKHSETNAINVNTFLQNHGQIEKGGEGVAEIIKGLEKVLDTDELYVVNERRINAAIDYLQSLTNKTEQK